MTISTVGPAPYTSFLHPAFVAAPAFICIFVSRLLGIRVKSSPALCEPYQAEDSEAERTVDRSHQRAGQRGGLLGADPGSASVTDDTSCQW